MRPISIRSSMWNRIRLDVPAVLFNPSRAAALEDSLRNLKGVTWVNVNPSTGSVLAMFDAEKDPSAFGGEVAYLLRRNPAVIQTGSKSELRRVLALAVPKGARNRVLPVTLTGIATTMGLLQVKAFTGFISIASGRTSRLLRILGFITSRSQLAALAVGALSLNVAQLILQNYRDQAWRRLSELTQTNLRQELFAHLANQDIDVFDKSRTSSLSNLLLGEVARVGDMVEATDKLVESGVTFAIGELTLARNALSLALVATSTLPVLALPSRILGARTSAAARGRAEASGKLSRVLANVLTGMFEVKAFTAEEFEKRRIDAAGKELAEASVKAGNAATLQSTTTQGTFTSVFTVAAAYGAGLVATHRVPIERYMDVLLWFPMLATSFTSGVLLLETYYAAKAAAGSILKVLETRPRFSGGSTRLDWLAVNGDIVFDNVSFGYEDDRPVLRDVSFHVGPGSTLAIVGPSGSGKSTLLALLLGFYHPTSGRISVDGHDITELDVGDLRRAITLVSQETYLFDDTFDANVKYGRPDAPEETVNAAIAAAEASELAKSLRSDPGFLLGERGQRLSGGERQRVAIARALVKDANILVLDEGTSHLDHRTEAKVRENIKRLGARKTTLIVEHRLATVQDVDKILVLDRGRLREQGTHAELLAQKGLYYELWQKRDK
ncbi:MAG: ATP-binding cassette domain-containing protein [Actinomycetota bacterium]